MNITKGDYDLWKVEPLTKAWFEACNQRIEEAKEQLAGSAGTDSDMDNFLRGFIHAYREMLDFRVDDIEEDDEA